MAMSSSAEDVGPSPQTCCAACATVFEVSPELLGSSDTRVRCGECHQIFDALENLVPDEGDVGRVAPPAGTAAGTGELAAFPGRDRAANGSRDADDAASLDVTYSDFDLFSEDADLPDVAYFDRTSDTPDFDFDSVEVEPDETFSDTLFAHDATLDAESIGAVPPRDPFAAPARAPTLEVVGPAVPREPLAFAYRDAEPSPTAPERDGDASVPVLPVAGAPGTGSAEAGRDGGDPGGRGDGDDRETAPDPLGPRGDDPASALADGYAAADADPSAEVPFELGPAEPGRRRRRWPAALMALALVGLLAGLHLWRVRDAPADDPLVRPFYELGCRVLGCEVPARVALDRLTLVRREMYERPGTQGVLTIDVAFRNDAPFAQRPPTLVVRLSTPSGRLVARRAFAAADYLPAGADPAAALAPGRRLDLRLDVADPGADASSFQIDFARPRTGP